MATEKTTQEKASKEMKLKTKIRATVVAAVGVVGLSLSTTPAAAATCPAICTKTNFAEGAGQYTGQIDNTYSATGSWVWVYGETQGGHVDYYLNGDSQMKTIWSPANGSNQQVLSKKVTAFRVCGPNWVGGDDCSTWAHPAFS
ncbi:hypothetical protein [Streptomyces sp. NPDC002133]|uniref:hypothetical protein n=1 Tax=Streptomyces sp. NPDC002133 TaxID=3154409 RepID=UPI00332D7735